MPISEAVPSFSSSLLEKVKVQNAASRARTLGNADNSESKYAAYPGALPVTIDCPINQKDNSEQRSITNSQDVVTSNKYAREESYSSNIIYLDHSNEPSSNSDGTDNHAVKLGSTCDASVEEKSCLIKCESHENREGMKNEVKNVIPKECSVTAEPGPALVSNSVMRPVSAVRTMVRNTAIQNQKRRLSIPMETEHSFFLVGRRNVLAHTLCSGYLLRTQSVLIELGNQNTAQNNKSNKSNKSNSASTSAASVYYNNLKNNNGNAKKDNFSGRNLMFSTYIERGQESQNKSLKNVNGRLPNILCDFLVPLIAANLISLKGHVAYDMGCVGVFVNVTLSIHILVSSEFFNLGDESYVGHNALNGNIRGKREKDDSQHSNTQGANKNSDVDFSGMDSVTYVHTLKARQDARKELLAHANDLLIW